MESIKLATVAAANAKSRRLERARSRARNSCYAGSL